MMHPLAAILTVVFALAGVVLLFKAVDYGASDSIRDHATMGGVTCLGLATWLVSQVTRNTRND
jgi:hypothetical protein